MRFVDFCPARPDEMVISDPEVLAAELAGCLARFLNGTADESTLSRSRRALERWHERLQRGAA